MVPHGEVEGEMSEQPPRQRNEKEEKGREGQGWDEKWRRDPVEAIVWSLILIWAGLVWLGESMSFWKETFGPHAEAWAIGFVGAGLIVLAGVVLRLVVPAYRRPIIGSVIFGIILLGIGLGQMVNWVAFGAIALIAIGVAILLTGLFRKRE
jgi:hypothetical protein